MLVCWKGKNTMYKINPLTMYKINNARINAKYFFKRIFLELKMYVVCNNHFPLFIRRKINNTLRFKFYLID